MVPHVYVLIVDDEKDLAELIEFNLRAAGIEAATAGTGKAALELIETRCPDLLVLDVMLPDISGKEVCQRLRAKPNCRELPVVMLTARGEETDRVEGFLSGTDDYVTKPFSVRELVLRIQALLRRSRPREDAVQLTSGAFVLDIAAHRFFVDGAHVELTALEFKLMRDFLCHLGHVRTREVLLTDVWGITGELETRTVDTHLMRLREKLGAHRERLETVRGIGYRLAGPRES